MKLDETNFVRKYNLHAVARDIKVNPYLHGLRDILTGLTNAKFNYRHEDDYYKREFACQKEAFAHMFEAYVRNDERKMNVYIDYLPNTWHTFMNLVRL